MTARAGRRARVRGLLAAPVLLAGGACVTTPLEFERSTAPLDLTPVVVPMAGGGGMGAGPAVTQYYTSVLEQMQEALLERDDAWLRQLVRSHRRDDAPAWARERIDGFRAAERGLAFERWLRSSARVVPLAAPGNLGADLQLALQIGGRWPPHESVVLGADGAGFLVRITVRDTDVLGTVTMRRSSAVLRVEQAVDLMAEEVLSLPFGVASPSDTAVLRDVAVAAYALPGAVLIDGERCPLAGNVPAEQAADGVDDAAVAIWSLRQVPAGAEPIRAEPLRTLRNTLRLRRPEYARQQYLAALWMPAADREPAAELLIDRVRLGEPDEARLAMACLAVLTGESISVEERDAWLQWWQHRATVQSPRR